MPVANTTVTTCAFNQSVGFSGEPISGVVATDQLAYGAGLTGFDTWQPVVLNVPLGAVE
jgi:hypothetical protein